MANIIEANSDDAARMLFSGNKTSGIQSSIKSALSDFTSGLQDITDELGVSLKDYVNDMFHDLNFGSTFKRLNALRASINFDVNSDNIMRLSNINELQSAGDRMQRWVMANTQLRSLFLDGEVSGYEGSYLNPQVDGLGSDFLDFRLATNGMVMKEVIVSDKEDVEDITRYSATSYFEETNNEDEGILSVNDRYNIMSTWDTIDSILDGTFEEDFTSVSEIINEVPGETSYDFLLA